MVDYVGQAIAGSQEDMLVAHTTISDDYSIKFPDEVRRRNEFKPGDRVGILQVGNSLRIVKTRTIEELQEKLKDADITGFRDEEDRM